MAVTGQRIDSFLIVSNLGQIKAGYLYGAFDSALTDFNIFTQTSDGLNDIFSAPGSQNYSGPASLYGVDISGLTENSPTSAKRVVPITARMGLARPLTQLERQQIASLEQQLEDVDAITLSGTLDYQACDDAICYLPVSVPVSFNLEFQQLDYERANR